MAQYTRLVPETLPAYAGLLSRELETRLRKEKNVFAIGAVDEGVACGILVAELSFNDMLLDVIYLLVAEEYRGKGIGHGIMDFLCEGARKTGIPIRCLFSATGKEDPLYGFFVDLPDFYISQEDGYTCRIPYMDLCSSQTLMAVEKYEKNAVSFFSLSEYEQKTFCHGLTDAGNFYLSDMAVYKNNYDAELCLCSKKGSEMKAAVFFLHDGEELVLDYAWCAPHQQASLFSLLAQAARKIAARGEGWLFIAAVEPQTEKLIEKIFPQREIVKRYFNAAYEMN